MSLAFLILVGLGLGYGLTKLASWIVLAGCLRVLVWQAYH